MDAKNRLVDSEKLFHLMSYLIAKLLIHPELMPVFMKAFEMKPQGTCVAESSEELKDANYADSWKLVQVAMGVQAVFSPSEHEYASPLRENLVRAYWNVVNAGVGVGSSMSISQVKKMMEEEDADVEFEPAALDQVIHEYQNALMGV